MVKIELDDEKKNVESFSFIDQKLSMINWVKVPKEM